MSTLLATEPPTTPRAKPRWKSIAELVNGFGDIPLERIRFDPYPGTATEVDFLDLSNSGVLCELIDGTLVEKPMGSPESYFASAIATFLNNFIFPRRLGVTSVTDGMYRMIHGNIREPDVAFTARKRLVHPLTQISDWCPDLCVEVLSPSNTRAEMSKKRAEYFAAGCRLVWIIDRTSKTATAFTDPNTFSKHDENGVLDGGDVLPGFELSLKELFDTIESCTNPND